MEPAQSDQSIIGGHQPSHHSGIRWSSYRILGTGLLVAGVGLAPVAYLLIGAIPLAALGLAMVILGMVCIALDMATPKVPTGVSLILMESGVENIAVLMEELGLRSRGIYLPSSSVEGQKAQALIPLRPEGTSITFGRPLARRFIVKYGPEDMDMGLLVSTPGSAALRMLESKPGPSSAEMGMALTSLLVGAIDAASAVSVFTENSKVTVEITGSKFPTNHNRLQECLGSPIASIAASIASEALDKPVTIEHEQQGKRGRYIVQLRVMSESI